MKTKTIHIYLAGPIAFCTDAQACDWREYAKTNLKKPYIIDTQRIKCEFLDPMVRDYREHYGDRTIDAEVVELDKRDIDQADVVFANITQPSAGTSMELLYSWERQKAIVTVVEKQIEVSPWITYHSTKVVRSLEEGIKWIQTHVR